jgi:hypothetical protein
MPINADLLVVLTVMKRVERMELTPDRDNDKDGSPLATGLYNLYWNF